MAWEQEKPWSKSCTALSALFIAKLLFLIIVTRYTVESDIASAFFKNESFGNKWMKVSVLCGKLFEVLVWIGFMIRGF